MKISVEYSESIEVAPGLWRKIGVNFQSDTETDAIHPSGKLSSADEMTQHLHNQAKEYVQKWHQEGAVGSGQLAASPAPEIQVEKDGLRNTINALSEDIMSCKDLKTIDSYRLVVKQKPELEEVFNKRRAEIVKQESAAILKSTDDYYQTHK